MFVYNSENLKTTINTVTQFQDSQQKLSSAVSSLQALQKNMQLDARMWSLFWLCNSLKFFKVFSGTIYGLDLENEQKVAFDTVYLRTVTRIELRLITLIKAESFFFLLNNKEIEKIHSRL